jgi:hypothetical protein
MFMEQVVECNTRGENILYLFFTTHPTLVEGTKTLLIDVAVYPWV